MAGCRAPKWNYQQHRASLSINVFCAFKCPRFVPQWLTTVYNIDIKVENYPCDQQSKHRISRASAQCLQKDTLLCKYSTWYSVHCAISIRWPQWQKGEALFVKCIIWSLWKSVLWVLVLEAAHSVPANMSSGSKWITAISPNYADVRGHTHTHMRAHSV